MLLRLLPYSAVHMQTDVSAVHAQVCREGSGSFSGLQFTMGDGLMKRSVPTVLSLVALLATLGVCFSPLARAADTQWTYPVIPNYGPIRPLPQAAVKPDKNKIYKAVFDITAGAEKPSEPERGLLAVARIVNSFGAAGVPLKNLRFIAVLHLAATNAVLDNNTYKAKYGIDNPNIPVIDALRKAGVHVDVCSQAMADMKIEPAQIYKQVRIDWGAFATVITYANMGYAAVKL